VTVGRRLLLVVGAAVGLFFLAAPGVAYADDCSSPSDCSNTAWTVAGGAAVAAVIVGTAMGTRRNGSEASECEEVGALRVSIRGSYQQLADLAVLRKGAVLSKSRAEAQLRMARDWAARLEGKVQISTTSSGHLASAGSTTAAAAGSYADRLQDAIAGAKSSDIARQRLAALTGTAAPSGSLVRPGMVSGGRTMTSSFWSKANRAFSVVGLALSAAGQYFNYQHRNDMRTLGILRQTIIQKQAEIKRWQSYVEELSAKIDAGFEALRASVRRCNEMNEKHSCGWSRLDLGDMRALLDSPPDVDGAAGAVPQHLLETEPPIHRATADERAEERERDRERFVCQAYDADLAAWNTLAESMKPKLDQWDEQLRHWAARGAAVQRVMASRSEIERSVREAIWGVTGNALGERVLAGGELGIAAIGLASFSWPVVAALGIGGALVSLARGQISPSDVELIAEGRIAAEMQFWSSRMVYIRAEITRIERMRTEVLSELQRRRIRLDRSYDWCSSWWNDRGEHHNRAEPVPVSYRRSYMNFAAFGSARYSAMPIPNLMQEIRTWR